MCSKISNVCLGVILVLGILLVILGIIIMCVVPVIMNDQIKKKVVLVNGSQTYDAWVSPDDVAVYMQFYVWNLTNGDDVWQTGAKPAMVELGPYTYREYRYKSGIVHNDNGTVTYRQYKAYQFVPDMSLGNDTDSFVTANLVLVALMDSLQFYDATLQKLISWAMQHVVHEELFVSLSVNQMVWGYEDKVLKFLHNHVDPIHFDTYIVGVLAGKNNTDDGLYTIYTGETDISKLGIIDTFDGSSSLPYWTTPYANMINGTDGTVLPPFVHKDQELYLFSMDVCRSMYATYYGEMTSRQGVPLYRFRPPKSAFQSVEENPDNAGFCTPSGNCMGGGVLNISVCQLVDGMHIPIVTSSPHFYMADPKYINGVTGMSPDPEQHNTEMDVEPHTGIVMQVAKRLQINVFIRNNSHNTQLAKMQSVVFPLVWVNESAQIDDANAKMVMQQLLIPLMVANVMQYTLLALGGAMVLLVCIIIVFNFFKRNTQHEVSGRTPKESSAGRKTSRGMRLLRRVNVRSSIGL